MRLRARHCLRRRRDGASQRNLQRPSQRSLGRRQASQRSLRRPPISPPPPLQPPGAPVGRGLAGAGAPAGRCAPMHVTAPVAVDALCPRGTQTWPSLPRTR